MQWIQSHLFQASRTLQSEEPGATCGAGSEQAIGLLPSSGDVV